jgi:putative transposase
MPYINALFHFAWSTKYRKAILKKDARSTLFTHIKENAKKKGIHLDCINGHDDHVYCVVSLSAHQTISKVIQLIKGESSW